MIGEVQVVFQTFRTPNVLIKWLTYAQMLLVTGGYSPARALDSTEVLDFTNRGEWRQTSPLPESRWGVRGASLGAVFHILGGQRGELLSTVLAWEPVEEAWQEVGELAVAASYRAVAEVPFSIGGSFCSNRHWHFCIHHKSVSNWFLFNGWILEDRLIRSWPPLQTEDQELVCLLWMPDHNMSRPWT